MMMQYISDRDETVEITVSGTSSVSSASSKCTTDEDDVIETIVNALNEVDISPSSTCAAADTGTRQSPANIASFHLEFPKFSKPLADIWFRQVESCLELRGLVTSVEKFNAFICLAPAEVLIKLEDLLFDTPAEDPFAKLRDRFSQQFVETEDEIMDRLLFQEIHVDEKPSVVLEEMTNEFGRKFRSWNMRALFLLRLPADIRDNLSVATRGNDSLRKIAELADDLMEKKRETSTIQQLRRQLQQKETELYLLQLQLTELQLQQRQQDEGQNVRRCRRRSQYRGRSASRARSCSRNRKSRSRYRFEVEQRSRDRTPAGIKSAMRIGGKAGFCWYHRHFRIAAVKCQPPCTF